VHTSSHFFDVHIFNSFAASNCSTTLAAAFRSHEAEKHHAYEEHICEVEHGSFTQLVFSSYGGMGKAATTTYKYLAIWLTYLVRSGVPIFSGDGLAPMQFGVLVASFLHHVHLWFTIPM